MSDSYFIDGLAAKSGGIVIAAEERANISHAPVSSP
jgi:hypothetical protein